MRPGPSPTRRRCSSSSAALRPTPPSSSAPGAQSSLPPFFRQSPCAQGRGRVDGLCDEPAAKLRQLGPLRGHQVGGGRRAKPRRLPRGHLSMAQSGLKPSLSHQLNRLACVTGAFHPGLRLCASFPSRSATALLQCRGCRARPRLPFADESAVPGAEEGTRGRHQGLLQAQDGLGGRL